MSTTHTDAGFTLAGVGVRRGERQILADISTTINAGICTALVGPSGAGKSTLLRLLNRFDDPTDGTINFHGQSLDSYDVLTLRRQVGLVFQKPTLLASTVRAELQIVDHEITDDAAAHLLTHVGLAPDMLGRVTSTLSGGEAQRLCFARALTVHPEVLLLDEPTSSLDPASAAAVEDTIKILANSGLTVVLVSHDREQAHRLAHHALVLDQGRLVEAGHVDTVSIYAGPSSASTSGNPTKRENVPASAISSAA